MLKNLLKYLFATLPLFVFFGCGNKTVSDGEAVAKVGTSKLYHEDVSSVIPDNLRKEDSILMADDYIRKWIKQELLLRKAEENLSEAEKDVSKQLEEYRKSLILYRYKNELMKQRMDTTVSEAQILDYYTENPEKFMLNKNIVKAIFIKIPAEFANPEQLKAMCKDTGTEGIIELRDYCVQYAKVFDIFVDRWVSFQTIANYIPEIIENQEQFLKNNQFIERTDSDYYYMVSILDYKLKNEQAPIEYVNDKIKNLILNRRKIDFLKQLEDNVYTEGIEKNKFKILKTELNGNE
ncbi:MAG: hypothetical protein ACOCWK_01785 [Tangfeifania sp.]